MAPRGVVLLLLASLVLGFASAQIRGIDPTKAEKYSQSSGSFTCLDGSKTIPFDRVNDNYCDCPGDGSDEPGTSACYHGTFWCRNRGFEPQTISSSFVDDGVCDCCDGSDEIKECPNTCLEKSAHERQAIRDKVASFQRALDKKTQAEADAATLQKRWSERHQTIHTDIEAKEEEVRKLEAEKAQLDAEVDAERAKQAAEEEAKKQQAAGEEQQQQATEGTPAEHEETAEERGRRIASQWTHDPEAAGVPAGELGEEEGHMGEYQPLEEEQPHYDDHHDHDHYPAWTPPPPPSPAQIAVNEVNGKLSSAKIALESLKEEKQKIDRYYVQRDSFDFGPNNVFLPLAGKCVSDVGSRWHYKACFFDKATQSEPHNMANVVTLGVWKGFNKDYSEAVFHNGDVCAGVGQRSFTVKLVCGEEEKMWGSEEPSTCVYAATMSTPVACKVADLEHEQRHLQELEAFEAEIRAEIEADRAKKAAASASDHTEL